MNVDTQIFLDTQMIRLTMGVLFKRKTREAAFASQWNSRWYCIITLSDEIWSFFYMSVNNHFWCIFVCWTRIRCLNLAVIILRKMSPKTTILKIFVRLYRLQIFFKISLMRKYWHLALIAFCFSYDFLFLRYSSFFM